MKKPRAYQKAAFATLLYASLFMGCARVSTPALRPSSGSVHAWGPISGSVVSPEPEFVIVNHELQAKASQIAISTGTPLKEVRIPQVSSSAQETKRSAWPKPELAIDPNPFQHPAPVNPLPEDLSQVRAISGEPLHDRFDKASVGAALASVEASGTPTSSPRPFTGVAAPTVLAQASQTSAQRARLAEPARSVSPAERAPQEIAPVAGSLAVTGQKAGAQSYRFSFSSEIWLLIVIIGGVFATLWFRLEYDFGARNRKRRW